MATFVSGLAEPKLGLTIAIAIAIHNIPESIAFLCRFIMLQVVRKGL